MSVLNDVRLAPALMCAAIILGAVAILAGITALILDRTDRDGLRFASVVWGVVCAAACVGLFISAAAVSSMHWNDNCHHHGGVLYGDGCIKPHSLIDVP
jgi:Na+/proline symporter